MSFDRSDDAGFPSLPWLSGAAGPKENGQPFVQGPVFASTYHLAGDPGPVADRYGRTDNPVWRSLEAALGAMEGGETVIFASGMAAAAACLMPFLRSGDRVLLPSDGYYTVRELAQEFLLPLGVGVDYYATAEAAALDLSGYALLWVETPSNPGLDVCDIAALAERARQAGTLLVCDNTTMTPLGQTCLALGADLVMSSDTKAINGHSDVLMGHVASAREDLIGRVRRWRVAGGAIPGPMETWLVLRGLQTLELRHERMCANALAVAELAAAHPAVVRVRQPGLAGDPAADLADRQMKGGCSLAALWFDGESAAERFLAGLELVYQATSFGGTHSLAERRARWDASNDPGLVRFSAGCEPTAALLADVRRALDAV